MLSRCTTILALAGSAAAFSPMMSMETGRREILQAGAALSLSAPLLRPDKANAAWSGPNFGSRHGTAPIITIFDHRGCTAHANAEYKVQSRTKHRSSTCSKHEFLSRQTLPRRRAVADLHASDRPYQMWNRMQACHLTHSL